MRISTATIRKWFSPTLVCLLFSIVYLGFVLAGNDWNAMALVRVGGHFDPRVGGAEMGYDGQFAYQIALDPLQGWKYTDIPAYRYQRILYPMLARVLSLGQAVILPWMMLLINLVSLTGSIWLLEKLLARYNFSRWYALSYGLFIGTLMSIRLNLNEPLAYFLVVAGIYALESDRKKWTISAFALAILCKEITLLFPLAFALEYLWKRKYRAATALTTSLVPFLLWKVVIFFWLHDWGLNSGGAMATSFEWLPYAGWWKLAVINPTGFLQISLVILPLVILPSVLSIRLGVIQLFRRVWTADVFLVLGYAGIIPFLPMSNIVDPMGISRMMMSLIIALIYYGVKRSSVRTLRNCLLFTLTAIFIWKDSFLPVGTYRE